MTIGVPASRSATSIRRSASTSTSGCRVRRSDGSTLGEARRRVVRRSSSCDRRARQVDLLEPLGVARRRRRTPAAARRGPRPTGRRRSAAARPVTPLTMLPVEADQADLAAQPVRRSPRRRAPATASITARTSAAEPPSAAWMKLACFSDTHAEPIAEPAQPEPVDQLPGADLAGHRVDEHRAGSSARPAGARAASARSRRSSPRTASRSPRRSRSRAGDDDLVVAEVRAAEAQPEVVDGHA